MKIFYTILFLLFIGCILTRSDLSVSYALLGLNLWFEKMIPSLLPFMILSGIMVRMKLTESFTTIIYPILRPLFKISQNACYAMFMGFLCGFPMGAKTTADLYERNMITREEAEYLLAFCNNIGPVYFVSFVLPLLGLQEVFPYLFGMYGIPLLYGLALRYSSFRKCIPWQKTATVSAQKTENTNATFMEILVHIDDAIHSAIQSILTLGGYMILFNLLNLIPHVLLGRAPLLLAPLFEISGGLKLLGNQMPLYTLLILPFGGFSCIAQTYSCIHKTDLSIVKYIFHKLILTFLVGGYYLLLFVLLNLMPSASLFSGN